MTLFNGIDLGYAITVAGSVGAGILSAWIVFRALRLVFRLAIGILLGLAVLRFLEIAVAESATRLHIGFTHGMP